MRKKIFVRNRKKWAAALLLLLGIAGLLAAACAVWLPKAREKARRAAVELSAEVILPMAGDGKVYFDALDFVCAYVSGEDSLEHVLDALERAENDLRTRQEASGDVPLPERADGTLKRAGIARKEFREFCGARSFWLDEYIWSLASLREYLDERGAEFEFDDEKYWMQSAEVLRETYWGMLYYAGINRWFAQWREEETDYVRERILDQLPPDVCGQYPWETQLFVIERKTDIFRKYREMFCELPPGYTEKEREESEKLQSGYEDETSVFPQGSWLYSLLAVKNVREEVLEREKMLEEYYDYYRQQQ